MPGIVAAILIVLLPCSALQAWGVERFPPPDFKSGHTLPETTVPPPRAAVLAWVDVAVLAAALVAAAWLALRKRSRRGVWLLMICCLLYFGFWRRGCICPVGAIQNVACAAFSGEGLPVTVLLFFLLPLAAALAFGRVFCAAVCPLGAAQDLVLFRPLEVPRWLEYALSLLPYVYLGVAVLLAAGGSAFIVCRWDPFVPFFRLSGSIQMLVVGGAMLVVSMFVGRAYCRYLCPYGVLLGLCSRLSRWKVTITPDECVACRLCEDACPCGAIRKPAPAGVFARGEGKGRLALLLVLTPVLAAGVGWLGSRWGASLARTNPTLRLAELVRLDTAGGAATPPNEVVAFRRTGRPEAELFDEASMVLGRYERGGWLLGGWVGIVIAARLIALTIRRRRMDYEPDRGSCLACARCYASCPRERLRLRKPEQTPWPMPAEKLK